MFDFAFFNMPWWGWVAVAFVVICWGLQNDKVGVALVLAAAYGMMGVGLYGIWSSGIPQATVASLARHTARIQAEKIRVAKIRLAGQEDAFAVVCPDFFAASWTDRNLGLWNLRWCNDYRDRL